MDTSQRAMTLVELLTVVSVLGIVLTLGVPAMESLLHSNRERTLLDQLLAHHHLARSHAASTLRDTELCGSSDLRKCDGDWSKNWLVREISTNEVLAQYNLLPSQRLEWRGFDKSLLYRGNGTTPRSNGRFTLCRKDRSVWELVINRQGRVRYVTPSTSGTICTTDHPSG